jgi:transposase-like protein
MKRNRYNVEFKQQVVREVQEVGNAAQVARRHELSPNLVYRWMQDVKHKKLQEAKQEAKSIPSYMPTAKEFEALEHENEKLKKLLGEKHLENEILRDLVKKTDPAYRTKLK